MTSDTVDGERLPSPADSALGLKQLEQKLGIGPRHTVAVINAPPESRLRLLTAGSLNPDQAHVVIGFATRPVDLTWLKPAYAAARSGRLAWVSYPKAGRPGVDLRRDWLVRALRHYGVEAAEDVSIDHAWSAIRLDPADVGRAVPAAKAGV